MLRRNLFKSFSALQMNEVSLALTTCCVWQYFWINSKMVCGVPSVHWRRYHVHKFFPYVSILVFVLLYVNVSLCLRTYSFQCLYTYFFAYVHLFFQLFVCFILQFAIAPTFSVVLISVFIKSRFCYSACESCVVKDSEWWWSYVFEPAPFFPC